MDPFFHTFIATVLCAVFFYGGYVYAWWKLRNMIVDQVTEAASRVRFVIEDDDEDTTRDDRLG
tara:strand:+ start:329 stop:517 length:189 start_codon:yes stop_codon:yes gene_type:complete